MPHRIEVGLMREHEDPAGEALRLKLREDLAIEVDDIRVVDVYTIDAALTTDEIERVRTELLTDAVIHDSSVDAPLAKDYAYLIEVGFRPGVTDNVGKTATLGLEDVLGRTLAPGEKTYKSTQYALRGALERDTCDHIARDLLANELIERWVIKSADEMAENNAPLLGIPAVTDDSEPAVRDIDLEIPDEALLALSQEMMLALDLLEMRAVQHYYRDEAVGSARAQRGLAACPTDIELEVLAQTWSEHCKHKIFAANIDYTEKSGQVRRIEGLFNTFIKAATDEVGKGIDWLVSVFHDNAGIVRFDEDYNFALKVETHNSPSALDPYGGALTGIVGVNRDIMGAGLGCKCILNTDVFCVASPEYDGPIPERLFHPKRVLRGVHAGVRDGGNQSGVPNVNGAIVFHDRFLGKPLVFCGTGGLIPSLVKSRPTESKCARPGDAIVMVGGRIGKDGIHGATFSSEALHEGSPSTAVQIGDPITQKNMADFLIEARDLGLYNSITDNGAGGLSSSVCEMACGSGGFEIHLERAPLKYPGLAPWEIFLSEAQERMTLAVPPENVDPLSALAKRREVEATVLGHFTDSGHMECYFDGKLMGLLAMDFLHNGVPTMELKAQLSPLAPEPPVELTDDDLGGDLKAVLGSLNVCSKESFVRMYDQEVQGRSVLKQFQGAEADGPGNAAVIRPRPDSDRGIAVACGITPKYSDLDTYAMMACAVDETVRNLVSIGVKLGTIAGLDNFCWPDPVESETTPDGKHKLAQLVRCCEALYDTCLAYGIPLISGKDSMKNDYRIGETKISIPPTVLFTGAGIVEDVNKAVSMDVKNPGDALYVLGETFDEMGGSEYLALRGRLGTSVPKVDTRRAKGLYKRLSNAIKQGLIASCHDCSDGGLGAALAETAIAGGLGVTADIRGMKMSRDVVALFSESASRFIVTVPQTSVGSFKASLEGSYFLALGQVTEEPFLRVQGLSGKIVVSLNELKEVWQRPLRW